MYNRIEVVSTAGFIHIKPFPEYLEKSLRFHEMVESFVPMSYRDRKSGEIKEFQKRDGYESHNRDLFTLSEATGGAITHRGLFRRVADLVKKNGDILSSSISYGLPSFVFGPHVVEGLRPEQIRVLLNILGEIGTGQVGWQSNPSLVQPIPSSGGALIEATMSTGKTHIIAALTKCFPHIQILVVTKKRGVMARLLEGLTELLPNERIGVFHGAKKCKERITVCSEVLLDSFDTSQIGLIIYDEVHNASGNVVSSTLLHFDRSIKVGLSGTLKKHKKLKFIESIFGPVVDTISDEEANEKNMVSPVKVYALSVPEGPDIADLGEIAMERWGITNNKKRNKLIAEISMAVPSDMQLIIFVRTIDHIDVLCEKFLTKDFVAYHGQLSDRSRADIERGIMSGELKRIIANDAMSEGVNTTKLRVMVEAGWSINDQTVSQRGGRNRRKDEGKKMGVIVTFLDDWLIETDLAGMYKDNPMKKRAKSRISNYKARKWPVFEIESVSQIDFSEIQES